MQYLPRRFIHSNTQDFAFAQLQKMSTEKKVLLQLTCRLSTSKYTQYPVEGMT